MATHAELAAKLLNEAANFFRNLGDQNPSLKTQMLQNASIFTQIAASLMKDPSAQLANKTYAEISAGLLNDAASFFRVLAEQNPPLQIQMTENAAVYDKIAELVKENPNGTLD